MQENIEGGGGRDKRVYTAALRHAKFYPPRQAAAVADHALRLPQCMSRNAQEVVSTVMSGPLFARNLTLPAYCFTLPFIPL